MRLVGLVFAVCLAVGCSVDQQVPVVEVAAVEELRPAVREVTVCDLKDDPARYNHAEVKVTGFFSRGFEDSTLFDPACKSDQWIWVELGGKRSIGVMYCCGFTPSRTREAELKVEGVTLPLVEDENFTRYDEALANKQRVKATVIGTFFSGKKRTYGGRTSYEGYGHMGIGSLFVVQQVLSSEITNVKMRVGGREY